MYKEVLKAKINCKVTESDVRYKGSITIDSEMLEKLGIDEFEAVEVNNRNGHRDRTYILKGERGSGIIACNGALSTNHAVGDKIHINCFRLVHEFHPVIEPNILNLTD